MPSRDPIAMPDFAHTDRSRIQGIVTSGYGHMVHTAYLFYQLTGESGSVCAWLRHLLATDMIRSAASWRSGKGEPKIKPEFAVNIAFTHAGLRTWGLDEATLNSFPREFADGPANGETAEVLGNTGENGADNWDFGGPSDPPIHLLLIVHATTCEERDRVLGILSDDIAQYAAGGLAESAPKQFGKHLIHIDPVSGARVVKEHFGFNDGISQPELKGLKTNVNSGRTKGQAESAAGEFLLGYPDEYGFYPATPLTGRAFDPQRLLSPSPYVAKHRGYRDFGYNGTYLVYRKLSQNVGRFWNYLRDQSAAIFGRNEPRFVLWLAAKLVGRWPNGVPLVAAPDLVDMTRHCDGLNDFLFAKEDPDGSRCPVGSHIRRTNPRDDLRPGAPAQSLGMTARHRIIRRGSSYGEPLFDLGILDRPDDRRALAVLRQLEDDGCDRGLHFLCLNANIRRQYEFIQQSWCGSHTFNNLNSDPDPLIRDIRDAGREEDQFTSPGHPHTVRLAGLPRFTTTRAAAYLFLPGFDTLRYLSEMP